jgi:prepilin-type N-terminal cleavage/methylation domain-containing protein
MSAPSRRIRPDEQGFTLLELMVVVLVVGILIAIALPQFLGARVRAQDRSAQGKVRNGILAQQIFFTDEQRYTEDVLELSAVDSSMNYTQVLAAMTPSGGVVYVELLPATDFPDDTVLLGAKSGSGRCFWMRRIAGGGPGFAANDCLAAPAPADFGTAW